MTHKKSVEALLDAYGRLVTSERAGANKSLFSKTRSIIECKFRGVPQSLAETDGRIPFVYTLSMGLCQQLFDLDMERFYKEPRYFLENWLRIAIFHFENFPDCSVYERFLPMWMGEGFEATLFGGRLIWKKDKDPCVDCNHIVIGDRDDLKRIKEPDFYSSGNMPLLLRFYKQLKDMVEGHQIQLGFKDWHYGPMAMLIYLRGFENALCDLITEREFAREILHFIVSSQVKWCGERDRFLGGAREHGALLYNDTACVPNISPRIYRETILPYEKMLREQFGTIAYYHNCGPIDPFLTDIRDLRKIDMIHSGPYSDYREVGKTFASHAPIELHLHPEKDFVKCDEQEFVKRLQEIKDTYASLGVNAYCVRLSSYSHVDLSLENNVRKLRRWCELSQNVLMDQF